MIKTATVKSLYGWAIHQLGDRAPLLLRENVTIASLIEVMASLRGGTAITPAEVGVVNACGGGKCLHVCVRACVGLGTHLSKLWVSCQGGAKNQTVITFDLREHVTPRVRTNVNKGSNTNTFRPTISLQLFGRSSVTRVSTWSSILPAFEGVFSVGLRDQSASFP